MSESLPIVKKLREAACCYSCRKAKKDPLEPADVVCTVDGVMELSHMICNHYEAPKDYSIKGNASLQGELEKIQKELKA